MQLPLQTIAIVQDWFRQMAPKCCHIPEVRMKKPFLLILFATLILAAAPASADRRHGHRSYDYGHSNHRYRNDYGRHYRRNRHHYGYGHRYGSRYRYRSRHHHWDAGYAVAGLLLGAALVDSTRDDRRGPQVVDRRVISSSGGNGSIHEGPLPATYYRIDGSDCLLIETGADGRRSATAVDGGYCN